MRSIVKSIALVQRRVNPGTSLFYLRHASTSSNPYPFPTHPNPTPLQIFHLPRNATKDDIKSRYYDLVRIYHPDSPVNRHVPSDVAQTRFQSISAAYDALRGKTGAADPDSGGPASSNANDYHSLSTAMWRARQRRRAELNFGLDERWKERLFMGAIFLTIATFVAQGFYTRQEALSGALKHPREDPFLTRAKRKSFDDSALASDVPPAKET